MLNLHSYRWRSFDLVADRGDAVDSALALFRPLRVPSLRRLRVSNITAQRSYEVGYAPGRHMDPVVPFEQFGAHIEELTVGSAFVNWDDRILECLDFSGLKSLNMSSMYIKVGPTMVQLFNILSKSPNLTTLVCNTFEGQEHPPLPFIVELPALRSLDFVWCGINRLTDFLQHLSAPNLRCFSLKWFCSMTMGIISTLMELDPDPPEIDAPTPLPATSFLQRLHALRISTPTSSGPERRRLLFYERMQDVRALVLETTTESIPDALQLALSELVRGRPPHHTSTSITPAVLLPHLTTLILMTAEAGLLRPFVEGRKNIGVPLKRLFADFASDYPMLEMEWLKQNLEVVGTVEKFWENEDGNLETWLALDAEPLDTARFAELCADVGCVVSGGYALAP
ncbi:hypothetical protein EWM64_g10130 [Hericium alpestre]|uniref:F-box domain-containing protein n=1 Tax=Hericium alpestre TaxID=135208 RepID=A0A4Y9ZJ47_9AGAM|nr:hypothetical protein EWM64_g10130 [Hericium alpestre]